MYEAKRGDGGNASKITGDLMMVAFDRFLLHHLENHLVLFENMSKPSGRRLKEFSTVCVAAKIWLFPMRVASTDVDIYSCDSERQALSDQAVRALGKRQKRQHEVQRPQNAKGKGSDRGKDED